MYTCYIIQGLTEDVNRQTEREKELQARYDKLNFDLQNLQVDYANQNGSAAGETTAPDADYMESSGV